MMWYSHKSTPTKLSHSAINSQRRPQRMVFQLHVLSPRTLTEVLALAGPRGELVIRPSSMSNLLNVLRGVYPDAILNRTYDNGLART